jgi:hypothetical protein
LLGATLPAQRPETGAAAAGENHGMEVRLSHSLWIFQIEDLRFQIENFSLNLQPEI